MLYRIGVSFIRMSHSMPVNRYSRTNFIHADEHYFQRNRISALLHILIQNNQWQSQELEWHDIFVSYDWVYVHHTMFPLKICREYVQKHIKQKFREVDGEKIEI